MGINFLQGTFINAFSGQIWITDIDRSVAAPEMKRDKKAPSGGRGLEAGGARGSAGGPELWLPAGAAVTHHLVFHGVLLSLVVDIGKR